jgi:hypothetical protein
VEFNKPQEVLGIQEMYYNLKKKCMASPVW